MTESTTSSPLIVGAGPVGLAAALLLARGGVRARIVDKLDRPSVWSKALAVNPRTLEILKPTGVTEKMLALGLPIRGATFWRGGRVLAEASFAGLNSEHPFLLALSQRVTERLLAEALREVNGSVVERGVELTACRNDAGGAVAELRRAGSDDVERHAGPWLLGADGARSTVRHAIGATFDGSSFDREWHLVDLPLHDAPAEDRAHVTFLDGGGFLFCLRVVEDPAERSPGAPPIWRVMSNLPDPLSRLAIARPGGEPVWTSSFHIAHRLADKLSDGAMFLAGDAVHLHSPLGARGMNLGIEDAWVFARLAASDQLDRYGGLRRPVDRAVVRRIELLTRAARGESAAARAARRFVLPAATRVPLVRGQMLATLTGLDHPLPAV